MSENLLTFDEQMNKDLAEMLQFIVAVKRSLGPDSVPKTVGMVSSIIEAGDEIAKELGDIDFAKLADIVKESKAQAKKDTTKLGVFSLMRTLNDPELQQGLKFILSLSKNLSKLTK